MSFKEFPEEVIEIKIKKDDYRVDLEDIVIDTVVSLDTIIDESEIETIDETEINSSSNSDSDQNNKGKMTKEKYLVELLNGIGEKGFASKTAKQLSTKSFRVVLEGNAGNFNYEKTHIVSWKGRKDKALLLADSLDVGQKQIVIFDFKQKPIDFTIVLGKDWKSKTINIQELEELGETFVAEEPTKKIINNNTLKRKEIIKDDEKEVIINNDKEAVLESIQEKN